MILHYYVVAILFSLKPCQAGIRNNAAKDGRKKIFGFAKTAFGQKSSHEVFDNFFCIPIKAKKSAKGEVFLEKVPWQKHYCFSGPKSHFFKVENVPFGC